MRKLAQVASAVVFSPIRWNFFYTSRFTPRTTNFLPFSRTFVHQKWDFLPQALRNQLFATPGSALRYSTDNSEDYADCHTSSWGFG